MTTSGNGDAPAAPELVEGTWDELLIHPTRLMTLVIDGRALIIGKDQRGRHIYRMTRATRDDNQRIASRGRAKTENSSKPEPA